MHASVITFTSQVGGSHQLELIPFHRDGVHVKKWGMLDRNFGMHTMRYLARIILCCLFFIFVLHCSVPSFFFFLSFSKRDVMQRQEMGSYVSLVFINGVQERLSIILHSYQQRLTYSMSYF